MSFLSLIVKNLLRQPVRTGLTVLGISIGITTVVALGVITAGLKSTSGELITAGGSDFLVAQQGTADLSFSTVSEADWQAVSRMPGVAQAIGVLIHITRAGDNPFFPVLGIRAEDLARRAVPLREGVLFPPGAGDVVVMGDSAAASLGVGVGGTVLVDRRTFTISGIYHAGTTFEDAGLYAPLATVQEMTSKPGTVTALFITTAPDSSTAAVATTIEERFPNLEAVTSVDEYDEVDQGLRLIDAANLAISVLAVGIGAIGVMNTMVMSVFERTRQIGILRAVGWSGSRIMRMILGESLILCLLAAVAGSLLGVLATLAIAELPEVRTLLKLEFAPVIFVRALLVAVIVALAGAIYPAIRAVRLTPMEALRYE